MTNDIRPCPRCDSTNVYYDGGLACFCCGDCPTSWDDSFTLVEVPDQTDRLPDDLGYPSAEAPNSNARYIPEYDYIRIFGEAPEPNSYFVPVRWPESQKYMSDEKHDGDPAGDSIHALNELINDEKGLADFGPNAYWVPLCNIQ